MTDKPFYETPLFNITWDGVIGDKFAFSLASLGVPDGYMVKVSDRVFTADEIIGARYILSSGGLYGVDSVDSSTFVGALNISRRVIIVYSADELNAALGAPSGYITNGTYFLKIEGKHYVSDLGKPLSIKPLDEKYLPDSVVLESELTAKGYQTEEQVTVLIDKALGVIENGTY